MYTRTGGPGTAPMILEQMKIAFFVLESTYAVVQMHYVAGVSPGDG